ncbi:MAG: histidinol dehydrogenase, partial [Victivallales bacterium]|nr:histidinol dehydrogenase [Victivallales bacterium]
ALVDYARKFDHVELTPATFRVTDAEIDSAIATLPPETTAAVDLAVEHIRDFYSQRLPLDWSYSPRPGVILGEQFHPLDIVGCYVPGGTAPLVSTVCHTVAIAKTVGVKEIIVCTPPHADGSVHPALLYACRKAGATAVYRLGGVYAVAAMAYGTATIPRVEKICGPGNAYVAAAKRAIYGSAALDLVAGPSEILILADDTANPEYVAADILSQAEHGSGREQAVLVSPSRKLLEAVAEEVPRQAALLTRQACVTKVLEQGVFLVEASDLDDAARIASDYAPEHLELQVADPKALAPKITAAGAIFLGGFTPEPVGDYVAGPSHVLPTGGTAKFFNGLTADAFIRRTSLIHYEREALLKEQPALAILTACEGLDAHGKSALIRN